MGMPSSRGASQALQHDRCMVVAFHPSGWRECTWRVPAGLRDVALCGEVVAQPHISTSLHCALPAADGQQKGQNSEGAAAII